MTGQELFTIIKKKKSFLCIGLDSDISKVPKHLLSTADPIFEFNKQIINHTKDYCVAYKPNIAFYESLGSKGWESLEKTIGYLHANCTDIFTIADAKRGDIGNTSKLYARAFFEQMNFDAITISPYMGEDSVSPFLEYKGKWVILLALTSNKGANDFQTSLLEKDEMLFEKVLHTSAKWGNLDNMMYVVGATKASMLTQIRKIIPDHFLLVPGVGAQGGDLQEVAKHGMNAHCGLIVNVSRNIIYAGEGENFALKAKEEASKIQKEMALILESLKI